MKGAVEGTALPDTNPGRQKLQQTILRAERYN
jgi:hypothetical protein